MKSDGVQRTMRRRNWLPRSDEFKSRATEWNLSEHPLLTPFQSRSKSSSWSKNAAANKISIRAIIIVVTNTNETFHPTLTPSQPLTQAQTTHQRCTIFRANRLSSGDSSTHKTYKALSPPPKTNTRPTPPLSNQITP